METKIKKITHLYYKVDDIRNEVCKRTSYIGKLRSDNGKNILDAVALTVDEEDLFLPFIQKAMADVFSPLSDFSDEESYPYDFNLSSVTILAPESVGGSTTYTAGTGTFDSTTKIFTLPIEDFQLTRTVLTTEKFTINFIITYQVTNFLGQTETRESKVIFSSKDNTQITLPDYSFSFDLKFPIEIDLEESEYTDAEEFIGMTNIEAGNAYVLPLVATDITAGTIVYNEYDRKYYRAITDTDTEADISDENIFESIIVDITESVHYALEFLPNWNSVLIGALDTAVFESLVLRTMWYWFRIAFPDLATPILEEYLEIIERVRSLTQQYTHCGKLTVYPY